MPQELCGAIQENTEDDEPNDCQSAKKPTSRQISATDFFVRLCRVISASPSKVPRRLVTAKLRGFWPEVTFGGAFSVAATGECFSAVELCGADASADRKSSQDGPRIRIHDNELLRIAADILSHYEEERHPSHAPAKLVLTIETKSVAAILLQVGPAKMRQRRLSVFRQTCCSAIRQWSLRGSRTTLKQ